MMFNKNILVLFFMMFICIIIRKTSSFENDEQEIVSDSFLESLMVNSNPSFNDQYPIIHKVNDIETPLFSNHHRSESAEKYFGWAGKTQRPVEFLRGKRFWLFAKKDDGGGVSAEIAPSVNAHHGSLAQGLWRSGIVGRRRR